MPCVQHGFGRRQAGCRADHGDVEVKIESEHLFGWMRPWGGEWMRTLPADPRAAWESCPRGCSLAKAASLAGIDLKILVAAAAACARALCPAHEPKHGGCLAAISIGEKYARGVVVSAGTAQEAACAARCAAATDVAYAVERAVKAGAEKRPLDASILLDFARTKAISACNGCDRLYVDRPEDYDAQKEAALEARHVARANAVRSVITYDMIAVLISAREA